MGEAARPPRGRVPRIAFFIPSLGVGGAERVMINLLKGLTEYPYLVDLILSTTAASPLLAEVPPSVRIVDLHAGRARASIPALVRYLVRSPPDFFVSSMNYVNIVTMIAASVAARVPRATPIPTKFYLVEQSTFSAALSRLPPRRARAMRALARRFYPRATAVIGCSDAVRNDLARALGPAVRLVTIPNPVVSDELFGLARAPSTHPWTLPGAPPLFVSLGRLVPEKDFGTLVRAFARVRATVPCRLSVMGSGALQGELVALARTLGIEADVEIPGYVENPYPVIAGAAAFVCSSVLEGLPSALLEAMMLGCPVVSTDCPGGSREILRSGALGALVPVGDPEALAQAMRDVLSRPRASAALEARAREFDVESATGKYVSLFGLKG